MVRGLGASLLLTGVSSTSVTERRIVAHLESSNGRNVSLYQRHGFEVVEEIEFAPGVDACDR